MQERENGVRAKSISSKGAGWIFFWGGDFRTDVPAVIGIVISNTMILAVNVVASGTINVGGHNILPTFKWIGSTPVMYKVTVCPAAAQGILFPSDEITVVLRDENPRFSRNDWSLPLTFYDTGFISRYDPQFLSGLDGTCAYPSRDACSGS